MLKGAQRPALPKRSPNKQTSPQCHLTALSLSPPHRHCHHRRTVTVTVTAVPQGITRDTLMMRMKPDMWQDVIDVNLSGVFYCSQVRPPGRWSLVAGR